MFMNLGASIASKATATSAETNFILRDTIGYPDFKPPKCWIELRPYAEGADAHIKSLRLGKPVFDEIHEAWANFESCSRFIE
jgi:hypothetical protein